MQQQARRICSSICNSQEQQPGAAVRSSSSGPVQGIDRQTGPGPCQESTGTGPGQEVKTGSLVTGHRPGGLERNWNWPRPIQDYHTKPTNKMGGWHSF